MKNKKNIILVASFIVLAIISFYAGTKMSPNKSSAQFSQNINGARGQMMGGQFQGMARGGNGNIFGKIIAKDSNSITVELGTFGTNNKGMNVQNTTNQTGSKIVFYTNTTTISKTATGTTNDLAVGKNISISGTPNPDGSVNAESVQIR